MTNPTVDEAFALCFKKMDAAAASVFVHPEGHAALKERYYKSFKARLDEPDSWQTDGPNVLRAAYEIGVIAQAIANLHGSPVATAHMALRAGQVIEDECTLLFRARGRWCTASETAAAR